MAYIFCGVNFPAPRSFQRIRVDNVNFNENSAALKERIKSEILNNSKCDISLVYLGNILADDEPIAKQPNIRSGSTIQVLKKPQEEEPKTYSKFTEMDVSRISSLYRSLNGGNFHKISRPEVIKTIFNKHPELEKDIVALSFLKDPILMATLQNPETVRKMGENHRALIEASDTICKALRTAVKSTVEPSPSVPAEPNFDQDFSDSSSSSGSEANSPQASTSAGTAARRRITSDLLRSSLAAATSNRNSLANISQRNLSQATGISPSGSSTSVPNRRNIISSSMFMNAINEVLQSRRSENEVPQSATPQEEQMPEIPPEQPQDSSEQMQTDEDEQTRAQREQADIEMIASFQVQLRQMEEMGLRNKAANIQALMVCNGNLEAAVNLVLAEMNLN